MSKYLHLDVSHDTVDGVSRWLTQLRDDDASEAIGIFHEIHSDVSFSRDIPLDGHVLAVLLHAAQLGKSLRVHGPLSRGMMRNLEELLLAWHCWLPQTYHKIDIVPDSVLDLRRGPVADKAISLFSGGVDASFTAIRHASVLPETLRYPLGDVLLVHGFDVDLENTAQFRNLIARVQPLLSELNLKLHTIRTNSRKQTRANWEHSAGLQMAACVHMLSDRFNYGLVGSSEPYDALIIPWCSSPITDYLMSGDRLSIVHDGAAFSRTEKVGFLANHPTACRTLKVCWAGKDQGTNCGVCEKCTRTRLNFLAVGVASPACFQEPLDMARITSIPLQNTTQLSELQTILRYARRKGIAADWVTLLQKRIAAGIGDGKGRSLRHRIKKLFARQMSRIMPQRA